MLFRSSGTGIKYVALGDSRASGPRLEPMYPDACSRSYENFAGKISRALEVAEFADDDDVGVFAHGSAHTVGQSFLVISIHADTTPPVTAETPGMPMATAIQAQSGSGQRGIRPARPAAPPRPPG